MAKYLSFHNSFFAWKYLFNNVNGGFIIENVKALFMNAKTNKKQQLETRRKRWLREKGKKETTHISNLFKIWIGAKFHCSPFEVKCKIWKCVSCTAKRVNPKNSSHDLVNNGREKWGPASKTKKKSHIKCQILIKFSNLRLIELIKLGKKIELCKIGLQKWLCKMKWALWN